MDSLSAVGNWILSLVGIGAVVYAVRVREIVGTFRSAPAALFSYCRCGKSPG
jgi:hypothetical protein